MEKDKMSQNFTSFMACRTVNTIRWGVGTFKQSRDDQIIETGTTQSLPILPFLIRHSNIAAGSQ